MDVLTEKRNLNISIYGIVTKLKFKNYKLNLAGSASLKSQRYYSDYDFNTLISRKYKPVAIYNEFMKILSQHDMYFIELKIEYIDNTNLKIYDISKLKKGMFNNIKYVKVDYVLWLEYVFKDLSIIYIFKTTPYSIDDIKDDYDALIQEGNNYKALKRLFSIYKFTKNRTQAIKLTTFFNSEYGKLYEINSNLKTIQLMTQHYDDDSINKKIAINLKYLKINPAYDIDELIKSNDIILNNVAKKYLI